MRGFCAGLRLFVVLVSAGALAYPAGASANSYPVTDPGDSGPNTLRQAIIDANASVGVPDTITFALPPASTITLTTGALPSIADNLTIQGPGASELTVSGNATSRIFFVNSSVTVSISGLTISSGHTADTGGSGSGGGGIRNSGTLTLSGVTVTGNQATATDSGGQAVALGGGISNAGTLTLQDSTVTANQATATETGVLNSLAIAEGGGIYNEGALTVSRSTLSSNNMAVATNDAGGSAAIAEGGAIRTAQANVALERSTISGNSASATDALGAASANGGGVNSGPGGALTMTSDTVSGNTAGFGANVRIGGGSATARSTILSAPSGGSNCNGTLVSQGYNLEDGTSCGFGATGDQSSTNPSLVGTSPADNGGPTQTFALMPGSLAIDAGSAFGFSVDQRGEQRPRILTGITNNGDGSDIGAYEVQTTTASPKDIDFGSVATGTSTPAQTVTVTNVSGGPLATGQAQLVGGNPGDFKITADTCSSTSLPNNGMCSIGVAFAPPGPTGGARNATLSLPDMGSITPLLVTLKGNAIDTIAPATTLGSVKIKRSRGKARFNFSSNEAGSTFLCKIDKKAFGSCSSPKKYKKLKAGKHKFRVKARDSAGNLDASPAIKKFRI
jgi:hypothetical protein